MRTEEDAAGASSGGWMSWGPSSWGIRGEALAVIQDQRGALCVDGIDARSDRRSQFAHRSSANRRNRCVYPANCKTVLLPLEIRLAFSNFLRAAKRRTAYTDLGGEDGERFRAADSCSRSMPT